MSKALIKETFRSIKNSISRFISIIAIVALGTCFFAGINAVSPDMRATADKYFDDNNLMDIKVISTIGLTGSDVSRIREVEGVEAVMPSKSVDAVISIDDKNLMGADGSVFSCRAYSLNLNHAKAEDNSEYINALTLIEGRLPKNDNECVVDGCITNVPKEFSIGQKITLEGDGYNIFSTLTHNEFTIVGIVETPMYISFERGSTLVGSGKLGGFVFVPEGLFCNDFYSEIYVKANGASEFSTYSVDYKEFIEPIMKNIESISGECIAVRSRALRATLPPKIEQGGLLLEQKRGQAQEELDKALQKVEDVKYYAVNGEVVLEQKKAETGAELDENWALYKNGLTKYNAGLEEYNKNYEEYLEVYETVYEDPEAKDKYRAASRELTKAWLQLTTANEGIAALEHSIKYIEAELNTERGEKLFEEIVADLLEGGYITPEDAMSKKEILKKLGEQKVKLKEEKIKYEKGLTEYQKNKAEADEIGAVFELLEKSDEQLDIARTELDEAYEELSKTKERLDFAQEQFEFEIKKAETELELAKQNVDTIDDQYRKTKKEIDAALNNAQYDLDSAKNLLDSLDEAKWFVSDRSELPGYESYNQTAQNMQAFATVFPMFFFLLAALICLTTMTRMVEEERVQLGTLKALGYTSQAIVSKYVIYATLATLIGCAIGLSFGFTLLPIGIYKSYGIIFTLPKLIYKFYFGYAFVGILVALLSTVLASLYACRNELISKPAQLMRPKAPKAGKRVALEKVDFFWSRLSFTSKVTLRNLFRHKKRLIMTVVGIGGCTALLLTGFGLGRSIGEILPRQYGEDGIAQYDMQILLDEPLNSSYAAEETLHIINSDLRIKSTTASYIRTTSATSENTQELFEVNLIVPERVEELPEFVKLQNRKTGKKISLDEKGVIVSEKLAKNTGVSVGDVIMIKGDHEDISLKVSGITENYAYHYIYITQSLYEAVFDENVSFNCLMAKLSDSVKPGSQIEKEKSALATDLMKSDNIVAVIFNSQIIDNFGSSVGTLQNVIVTVFSGAAGALALVVLYNLANININERIRELATIKVLGFYDKEVSQYIYRENIILTFLGIVLGLVLGIPIHSYVVSVAEVNIIMFGRSLGWSSFVWSTLITLGFALIVNIAMHFKIKKISMVESLKSVE
ncbi:MAG TPA: FtsX-like permease family protein [Clostridia bacterium]|nr:FtsX-like permease family protein [Clostridia bacterium]